MSNGGRRPLIGISTYREQARWGYWDVPAVLLPATYADAVAECGGEPVLLPTGSISPGMVERLDGLVLAGGSDIDPARYGQPPGEHTTVLRPDRDDAELAVLAAALERDLPLLAVCRGMQLLNVLLGGDLVQHLPDVPGAGSHQTGPGIYARRDVTTVPGTRLADLLGPAASAECHHHQALGKVADGLTPAAWAEDGVLEAVEASGRRFCLGVQWHPEAGDGPTKDYRLFGALVQAAQQPIA
jgi:anthranilate synthase component 2/putative glutamine amidotransferase